jgi:tRNA(Ile)-lysidine synthase
MRKEFIKVVEQTVQRHHMFSDGELIMVAFSGGPDSVCLLDVLERLKSKYGVRLCLAHFNHKLRGRAAEEDALFAEEVAKRRKMMFVSSAGDVADYAKEHRLSTEEAGRILRYEFFLRSSLSTGAAKVALGHTADDQAETILMRLIRGAGPGGLAGIPPTRPLNETKGITIVRPLINTWRSDIMQFLEEKKLVFREDASNKEPDYFRNRIRLQLIPHLEKEFNPQIKQRLAGTASSLAIENDFLAKEGSLLAEEVVLERRPHWVVFDAKMLGGLHPALRARILLRLMKMVRPNPPMLEASHIAGMDIILSSGGKIQLPARICLEISEGAGLIMDLSARSTPPKQAVPISLSGTTAIAALNLVVKTGVLQKISSPSRLVHLCTPTRQYFDLRTIRPPLEIRVRRAGDSFLPLGSRGRKKLKDFFIDKKVPRFLRQHIPLLISHGKIIWIMGYAIDEHFKLTPDSTSALRVDYERVPT